MKLYDIQQIALAVPAQRAFAVIADPRRLPDWAEAFAAADTSSAIMRTPNGEVRVGLSIAASPAAGTVDWTMHFPDGGVGRAHSRVVELASDRCVYTFVLHAPPAPLEAIEGALEAQSTALARELVRLKALVEGR